MTKQPDQKPKIFKISLPIRLGAGVVAAGLAAAAAHIFIGEAITTGVAAVFFGLGTVISLGEGGDDGSGGDGGGG
jgi:hypothetical protein